MRKKARLILSLCLSAASLAVARLVWAQFGINELNNTIILGQVDPRVLIIRIIQIALSFLGVLAILIILYAGFKWMTSGGDEEKIRQAGKVLRDALIGLLIILASWAIVTFVFSRLLGVIGGGGGNNPPGGGNNFDGGLAAVGACSLDSFYPAAGQTEVPRNTSIMVSFKEEIKPDSLCVNNQGEACVCGAVACANKLNPLAIRLYKTDLGDACTDSCPNPNTNITDVLVVLTADHKTLTLTPLAYLGSPASNTFYTIKLTNQLKNADNVSLFKNCLNDYAAWNFEVSSRLDLTPPVVKVGGIFPLPDNLSDVYNSAPAQAATARIIVNQCPHVFQAASVISIEPTEAQVVLDYHGALNLFKVLVPAGNPDKAQLFDVNNNLLGVADFDGAGTAVFADYLSFTASSHPEGSLWTINITPEQAADTLTVASELYTFATSNENNNILVPSPHCSPSLMATNIEAKLSGNADVAVVRNGARLNLSAKVAGSGGNDLALSTTNNEALVLTLFSGGADKEESVQVKDKPDNPMNAVIQINFSEAVNPAMVSGAAGDVADYIRVVNAEENAQAVGASCAQAADCRSYKCENNVCVGDYLGGQFTVAGNYKTVEFNSDNECGLNGCGEKIYCLPPHSHLAVKLVAADLKPCQSDNDCLALAPFKTCAATNLGYKTCQDEAGENYPSADLNGLDGITDAAFNSLDGNRSAYADGPLYFYSDNYPPESQPDKKDKYKWSFYISDQIQASAPLITAISPAQGQSDLNLSEPVVITFNTLMMNSTLRTGSLTVKSGTSTQEHKLINLRAFTPRALGYWIGSENLDTPPLDGVPDISQASIYHSPLEQSVSYKAQVGSGVKDIYQNCYKPAAGPGCEVTPLAPSCCFGTATDTLDIDGDCP